MSAAFAMPPVSLEEKTLEQQTYRLMAQVPTLAELGLKDSEVYAFQGILGPKGLPPAIVQRLNADLQKALKDPDVVKRMADFGMEALPGTPEQFHQLARTEAKRWGEVIKTAGVKLD